MRPRILIVDDDPGLRRILRSWLPEGSPSWEAADVPSGLELLLQEAPDVAFVDVHMPGGGGHAFVAEAQRYLPGCAIVGISGDAGAAEFVALMRLGMADFLTKPFTRDDAQRAIPRALRMRARRDELARLHPDESLLPVGEPFDALIGESAAWRAASTALRAAAASNAGVLISGPTGSGKSLAARCLHAASARADHPLVVVPCGALAASLVQIELFGHVAGAFTGGPDARAGAFEVARGGTVVLAEVGSLPLDVQGSLLRVLDTGAVQRIGEAHERSVDVRIVSTTSSPLAQLAKSGVLRQDLLNRIDRLRVSLPPLEERGDDVLLLANHLLRRHAHAAQRRAPSLSPAAAAAIRSRPWPGNVRELGNLLERACISASWPDVIDARHLDANPAGRSEAPRDPGDWPLPEGGLSLPGLLRDVEDALVRQAMARAEGHHGRAASLLRIARSSLERKLARS